LRAHRHLGTPPLETVITDCLPVLRLSSREATRVRLEARSLGSGTRETEPPWRSSVSGPRQVRSSLEGLPLPASFDPCVCGGGLQVVKPRSWSWSAPWKQCRKPTSFEDTDTRCSWVRAQHLALVQSHP